MRPRQRLGKYRIVKLIGSGGFASVYSAVDEIEGRQVAIKIPLDAYVDAEMLQQFRNEVRLIAQLEHPNILPLRNADIIDGRFVMVSLLGIETLDDRLQRRISTLKAISFIEQMTDAVAYAHQQNIVHCDLKPENFILFDGDVLRLADFGIAKVVRMTLAGSGTGTVGHMAPEQAMGRPSFRSDVFSLGLIFYRLLAGNWPEYPFDWPPRGAGKLRSKRIHPELIRLIRKAIEPLSRARFADADVMQQSLESILPLVHRNLNKKQK